MDIVFLATHILGTLIFLMFMLLLILILLALMWLPFEAEFPDEAERLKKNIGKRINRWIDRIGS